MRTIEKRKQDVRRIAGGILGSHRLADPGGAFGVGGIAKEPVERLGGPFDGIAAAFEHQAGAEALDAGDGGGAAGFWGIRALRPRPSAGRFSATLAT